jgi:hypothetical protein
VDQNGGAHCGLFVAGLERYARGDLVLGLALPLADAFPQWLTGGYAQG